MAERLAGMPVSVKAHQRAPAPAPARKTGKVIVVVSPKGGSGKTAVATNLAAALAMRFPGRVAAIDLDVQFGDMCTSHGPAPGAQPGPGGAVQPGGCHHHQAVPHPLRPGPVRALRGAHPGRGRRGDPRACESV